MISPFPFIQTIKRSLLWGVIFLFSRYLVDYFFGISYVERWPLFFLLLLLLFGLMLFSNLQTAKNLLPHLSIFRVITFLFILLSGTYLYLFFPVNKELAHQLFPYQYFALFDWRYLITKTLDIIFQQFIFMMVLEDLLKTYSKKRMLIFFIILMGIMHIPTALIFGLPIGPIFILAGMLAAVAFSYLLLHPRLGLCYSLSLHWSYYLVLGLWMRQHFSLGL